MDTARMAAPPEIRDSNAAHGINQPVRRGRHVHAGEEKAERTRRIDPRHFVLRDQPASQRLADRFGFRVDVELVVRGADVTAHRIHADLEPLCGRLIAVTIRE